MCPFLYPPFSNCRTVNISRVIRLWRDVPVSPPDKKACSKGVIQPSRGPDHRGQTLSAASPSSPSRSPAEQDKKYVVPRIVLLLDGLQTKILVGAPVDLSNKIGHEQVQLHTHGQLEWGVIGSE